MKFPTVFRKDDKWVEDLNTRIYSRNVPSIPVEQDLRSRPIQTRQVLFPTSLSPPNIDAHKTPMGVSGHKYHSKKSFFPGQSGPYASFAVNVDDESLIRSQFSQYKKYGNATEFIPSSDSSMFKGAVFGEKTYMNVPSKHTDLFRSHVPDVNYQPNERSAVKCRVPEKKLAPITFNNHTRQNLKNCNDR